jgi:hypothetical protein
MDGVRAAADATSEISLVDALESESGAGADFVHANNSRSNRTEDVLVYPGQVSISYHVRILGDVTPEEDETFLLHVHAPRSFRPQPIIPDDSNRVVTLVNDD